MPPGKAADFRRMVLVRHGESTANRDRLLTGRIDPGLTRRGHRQALRAARYIARRIGNVDLVFSSPLQRSLETAGVIARRLNRTIAPDGLLLETDFGGWEGRSVNELVSAPEWERYTRDPFHFTFPGGESPQQGTAFSSRFAQPRRLEHRCSRNTLHPPRFFRAPRAGWYGRNKGAFRHRQCFDHGAPYIRERRIPGAA
jgi:broad specificity phosphatase PhoE